MTTFFSSADPTMRPAEDIRLRGFVATAFTPHRIGQVRTAPTHAASVPFICSALGVPRADWPLLSRWADQLAHPASDAAFRGALYDVYAYVDVMVADRCNNLKDDLLSDLIMAQVDGDGLDSDELRRLVAGALMDVEGSCLGTHLVRIRGRRPIRRRSGCRWPRTNASRPQTE